MAISVVELSLKKDISAPYLTKICLKRLRYYCTVESDCYFTPSTNGLQKMTTFSRGSFYTLTCHANVYIFLFIIWTYFTLAYLYLRYEFLFFLAQLNTRQRSVNERQWYSIVCLTGPYVIIICLCAVCRTYFIFIYIYRWQGEETISFTRTLCLCQSHQRERFIHTRMPH